LQEVIAGSDCRKKESESEKVKKMCVRNMCVRNMSGTCQEHVRNMSGTCQEHVGDVPHQEQEKAVELYQSTGL
jgi:hypothetical protein